MVFRGGAGGWLEAGLPCAGSGKLPGNGAEGKRKADRFRSRFPETENGEGGDRSKRTEESGPAEWRVRTCRGYRDYDPCGGTDRAAGGEAAGGGDLRQQPAGLRGGCALADFAGQRRSACGYAGDCAKGSKVARFRYLPGCRNFRGTDCGDSHRGKYNHAAYFCRRVLRGTGAGALRAGGHFPPPFFRGRQRRCPAAGNFRLCGGRCGGRHLRAGNHGTGRTGALSGSWHQWRDGALGRPAALYRVHCCRPGL